MVVRHRDHKSRRLASLIRNVVPTKLPLIAKPAIEPRKVSDSFSLSDTDRLTYSFLEERSKSRAVLQINTVTYDVLIDDKWVTALYYDSVHGNLHRHLVVSADTPQDSVTTYDGVKQKGTQRKWLTWAINDIKYRFRYYRKEFLKRSGLAGKSNGR